MILEFSARVLSSARVGSSAGAKSAQLHKPSSLTRRGKRWALELRRHRPFSVVLAVGALAFTFDPAGAAEPVRYTVLMASNPAGSQVVSEGPNGERHYEYEFNDRGRGPKLKTRIVLGDGGIPTSLEVTGTDYYKKPVDEKFSIHDGHATWKSDTESGDRPVTGPAYYVSMNGPPEEAAIMVRALLAAPDHKLSLYPEGEMWVSRIGDLEVHANGKSRKVVQYGIEGLAFSPFSVWLDEDGTYFGSGGSWSATLREGWESVLPDLIKAQDAAMDARFVKLAQTLAHKPAALVFKNATLFDSDAAVERRGTTVVVSDGKIQAVGPEGSVAIPSGAEVIDASGKTLLPGLWDMHVHLGGLEDGLIDIAAGVTTVRDLANDIDKLGDWSQKFDSGSAIGPRVIKAGFIDGPGPFQGPTKVLADTPEEVRAAVDRYAQLGYAQIKLYSSLKPELVPVAIEAAHAHHLRVSGHIPNGLTAEQCVKLGFDEIQHANFLVLNFLADLNIDTRTPARFIAVAEHAATLDLGSKRVQDFIALLKEHGTVSDPTLDGFEEMFMGRPGVVLPGYEPIVNRLPPQVRRGFLTGGLPVPEGKDQTYKDSFQKLLDLVALMYKAGITIVAGTDALGGFSLPHELELYVKAGIPAAKVLQIATLGGAKVMKLDQQYGSIVPGKVADLVLVDGEPVWNISDIRKVEWVVKGGSMYKAAELYRSLGIQP